KQDLHVFVALEDGAERGRDVGRRQSTGRYLIQEWLKQMIVSPVEQCHAYGSVLQGMSHLQPRKPAAGNHHLMCLFHHDDFIPAGSSLHAGRAGNNEVGVVLLLIIGYLPPREVRMERDAMP